MSIGTKIKNLRQSHNMTQSQLGEILGVKKSAIAKYENNRVKNLKKATIEKLAQTFQVSPSYFFADPLDSTKVNQIPLYSNSLAKIPDSLAEIVLPVTFLPHKSTYFAQYADGDSMINSGIGKGDLLVFDKTLTIDKGQIGCFQIDDALVCKKYFIDNNKNIILQSANDNYQPIVVNKNNDFKIIGKLVTIIKKT